MTADDPPLASAVKLLLVQNGEFFDQVDFFVAGLVPAIPIVKAPEQAQSRRPDTGNGRRFNKGENRRAFHDSNPINRSAARSRVLAPG
jgi:hypothetical protein